MSSLGRRGAGDWPYFPGKGRHFFKIILDTTINPDGKLGIPGMFVRKYEEFLSNSVSLKVPNGAVWKVELMKCDDDSEVWLQKGWPDFAKFYSIGYGDFLVFRYEGNSNFHVLIFDKSATEIEYPSDTTHSEELNLDQVVKIEEIEHDDSVEIFDDLSKKRGKTPLQSLRPCKMTRTNPTSKVGNTSNSKQQSPALHTRSKGIKKRTIKCTKSKREVGSHSSIKEVKAEVGSGDVPPRREQSKALERMQLVTALERAEAYKPKNPFFMVPMGRSYVTRGPLSVPASFASKYFTENVNVILRVSDGRTWSVKGRSKVYDTGLISQLHCGWKSFAKANNLKLGDVCVFELVEGSGITLEVVIFRVGEGRRLMKCEKSKRDIGFHCSPQEFGEVGSGVVPPRCEHSKALEGMQSVTALERAKAYKSKNPFFMVPMHRSYVAGGPLTVPINFALQHFTQNCNVILRVSDGRTWSVKGRSKSYGTGLISQLYGGWRLFVEANNLKVGDVCVFDLVEGSEITLEVVIFRVSEGANYEGIQSRRLMKCAKSKRDIGFHSSPQEFGEGSAVMPIKVQKYEALGRMQSVTAIERARALQRAKAFKSKNPFFIVKIQPSYIRRALHMPTSFASRYFSRKPTNVILRASDGRTWSVKGCLKAYDSGMCPLLNCGWREFAKDNNLKVGNVCVFELVKRTEITLEVFIF